MKYNPNIHHRQSIRLRGYDYSQPGAYFITICTQHHECCLGEIINGDMKFTVRGAIAFRLWLQIPDHFPNVELDEFIIMPNHIHGIIVITDKLTDGGQIVGVGHEVAGHQGVGHQGAGHQGVGHQGAGHQGAETAPLRRRKPTLGQVVAYYKYQTTKIINQIDHTPKNRVWQRNYYDRIIRHPNTFHLIQKYIIANPIRWHQDPINPRRGAVSAP
ncbi:MAG: transposase [Goleter apudmare HA4340-LM2]|nr:transposase [Goleter apudmare HA4340-LM2]